MNLSILYDATVTTYDTKQIRLRGERASKREEERKRKGGERESEIHKNKNKNNNHIKSLQVN